ncbi:hypothetical protein ACFC1T_12380 [Kitasatospora sp. NPDC056076]|uniref:hypothetical protein n=1 Tax=Kitasatospora sp. NPDC056076 TaxID=3345703 RepID=UPI0035E28A9C
MTGTSEPGAPAEPAQLVEPTRPTESTEPTEPTESADPAGSAVAEGPLGVELLPTGHPGVDAGLARLEALDGVPAEAHVAVYEDVHQRLADALAALDQE